MTYSDLRILYFWCDDRLDNVKNFFTLLMHGVTRLESSFALWKWNLRVKAGLTKVDLDWIPVASSGKVSNCSAVDSAAGAGAALAVVVDVVVVVAAAAAAAGVGVGAAGAAESASTGAAPFCATWRAGSGTKPAQQQQHENGLHLSWDQRAYNAELRQRKITWNLGSVKFSLV